MSTEISTITTDGFAVQERTTSASAIVGKMMKFIDGDFIIDKTETLPDDTRLVANAVVTAWVKWQDGRPVDHRVTPPGQMHPTREEFDDLDRSQWPLAFGQPSDPWKDTRYLHLLDQRTGTDYTFVTDTNGGRKGIADLKGAIANVRYAHPVAMPIVIPESVDMKTQYGTKQRPQFRVVDWIGKQQAPMRGAPTVKHGHSGKSDPISSGVALKSDMNDDIPFAPEFR
jgi:hypothetical protein